MDPKALNWRSLTSTRNKRLASSGVRVSFVKDLLQFPWPDSYLSHITRADLGPPGPGVDFRVPKHIQAATTFAAALAAASVSAAALVSAEAAVVSAMLKSLRR